VENSRIFGAWPTSGRQKKHVKQGAKVARPSGSASPHQTLNVKINSNQFTRPCKNVV